MLVPFSSNEDHDFFQHLEMHLRTEYTTLCGPDLDAFNLSDKIGLEVWFFLKLNENFIGIFTGGFLKEIYNTKLFSKKYGNLFFMLIPLSIISQKFSFKDFFLKKVI